MIAGRCVVLELIVISTFNGVLYGMLLFLMASGLTVIFSMLGVLNFAHASFYMLGAFFGFQISRWIGFWPALLIAPLLVGAHWRRRGTVWSAPGPQERPRRRTIVHFRPRLRHRRGGADHLGKEPGRFPRAAAARFSSVHDFLDQLPRLQDVHAAGVDRHLRRAVLITLKKTRIGLIVQAALTHPHMVGHLGHNVGRIFMLVFGVGTALAAVAGVIAGPALVTQSNMAGLLGPILFVVVVVGGLGSLPGAFIASLLIGLVQTFAVSMNGSLAERFGPLAPGLRSDLCRRYLERHHRPDRADHALLAAGVDPDLPPDGPVGNARNMSDLSNVAASAGSPAPPKTPVLWLVDRYRRSARGAAANIFRSGGALTAFSLVGISIIFSLSYNILLGQTGMLSFGHAVYYGLGGFLAIHGMNLIAGLKLPVPLPLVPSIGALAGLFFAVSSAGYRPVEAVRPLR